VAMSAGGDRGGRLTARFLWLLALAVGAGVSMFALTVAGRDQERGGPVAAAVAKIGARDRRTVLDGCVELVRIFDLRAPHEVRPHVRVSPQEIDDLGSGLTAWLGSSDEELRTQSAALLAAIPVEYPACLNRALALMDEVDTWDIGYASALLDVVSRYWSASPVEAKAAVRRLLLRAAPAQLSGRICCRIAELEWNDVVGEVLASGDATDQWAGILWGLATCGGRAGLTKHDFRRLCAAGGVGVCLAALRLLLAAVEFSESDVEFVLELVRDGAGGTGPRAVECLGRAEKFELQRGAVRSALIGALTDGRPEWRSAACLAIARWAVVPPEILAILRSLASSDSSVEVRRLARAAIH
jgi:hypothetical protein